MARGSSPTPKLTARNTLVALAVLVFGVMVVTLALSVIRTRQIRQVSQRLYGADRVEALQVLGDLRANGWLYDEHMPRLSLDKMDLREADLSGANLRGMEIVEARLNGANLSGANLSQTVLVDCDLRGADLSGANLQGAVIWQSDLEGARGLTETQFVHMNGLWHATMPDGTLYDGRYLLRRDLNSPLQFGPDLATDDPVVMAEHYGVPLETYQSGQEWAQDHLMDARQDMPNETTAAPVQPGAIAVLVAAVFSLLAAPLVWTALPES